MPTCRANGINLHYELTGIGDGPVLLFSNSLGATLDMWAPQLERFQTQYRILLYDSRGHGQSETPPGPYTIEMLARDVLGLTAALGISRVHYCGLSMGGMVGQWLGVHAPHLLERLILSNTAAKIGSENSWNQRIASVQKLGMAGVAPTVAARWFTENFFFNSSATTEIFEQMLRNSPAEGYAASCAAIRDMDLRPSISRISVPVLVISGNEDKATTPDDAQFLVKTIPGAIGVGLPAAHLSNVEAAEIFNRHLESFLIGKE